MLPEALASNSPFSELTGPIYTSPLGATYKRAPIQENVFSAEVLHARREWDDIFKVIKGKKMNSQSRILYLAKLPLKNEGKIKTLPNK